MYLQAAELCEQAVLEAEEWQQVTDWLRVIRVDSRVLDAGVCVLLCMCAVVYVCCCLFAESDNCCGC